MGKRDIAIVKPEMLIWARKTANMSLEDSAQRAHMTVEKLKCWENGDASPTIKQAHILAHIYQQPFAAFYLPGPPAKKYPKVHDYRTLPKASKGYISPDLTLEVHKTAERREIALELYDEKGEKPPVFNLRTSLSEDPEEVGSFMREELGINSLKQISWGNSNIAFRNWREKVEVLGILVFQIEDVKVGEVRGFSISDQYLPVIAINNKDAPQAKIFSMLHELTHIMLRTSGLCDPISLYHRSRESGGQVEMFCNQVAAGILIPKRMFLQEPIIFQIQQSEHWGNREIDTLARKYNTSREAILRRLLTFGLISNDMYRQKRAEYKVYNSSRFKLHSGFAHPVTRSISINGKPFSRLVVSAYRSNYITSHDLANYLDIKISHLKRLSDTVGIG
jgi:Zn-dependent peptidase ImmA (M78 family)